MGVLRNGKSSLAQLLVKDFAAGEEKAKTRFTIPDKSGSPALANGAGTVNVTNGSTAVAGTDTSFTTDFLVGDSILIGNDTEARVITVITSATALTLLTAYGGTTNAAATYKPTNFSNYFPDGVFIFAESANDGRYGAMSMGSSLTAEAGTQTGLGAEFTAGGLARRSGANVKTYLTNKEGASGGWQANWKTTWTLDADVSIGEFAVDSDPQRRQGLPLLRQAMDEAQEGKVGDKVNVILAVLVTGSNVTGALPANQTVVTFEALREACRLLMGPDTTRRGENDVAGDWKTDYTIGGEAARVPKQFDSVMVGSDDGTVLPVARSNTELGAEHTTLGGSRKTGVQGANGVRGSLRNEFTDEPYTGSNEADAFEADSFEVFAGDTVQWAARFSFSGAIDVSEVGFGNGTNESSDPGVLGARFTYINIADFDETWGFVPVLRVQVL